jgi:hypothetical protein
VLATLFDALHVLDHVDLKSKKLNVHIPNATLKTKDSSDGHGTFLLGFEQLITHLRTFLNSVLPGLMEQIQNTPLVRIQNASKE